MVNHQIASALLLRFVYMGHIPKQILVCLNVVSRLSR